MGFGNTCDDIGLLSIVKVDSKSPRSKARFSGTSFQTVAATLLLPTLFQKKGFKRFAGWDTLGLDPILEAEEREGGGGGHPTPTGPGGGGGGGPLAIGPRGGGGGGGGGGEIIGGGGSDGK